MELRFLVARATRDVDLVVREPRTYLDNSNSSEAIRNALQEAVSIDLDDYFDFAVAQSEASLEGPKYGGTRFSVEASVGGRQYDRFSVDVALDLSPLRPVEILSVNGWLAEYGFPPVSYHMTNIEQQFAEKIHAYTFPRSIGENSRVKDLVDLALLAKSDRMNAKPLVKSIGTVFRIRGTHQLPGVLPPPPESWEQPFRELAKECDLEITMSEAIQHVQDYLAAQGLRGTPSDT